MTSYDYSTINVSRRRGEAAMRAGTETDWDHLSPHERAVDTIANVLHAYYYETNMHDLNAYSGGDAILESANRHFTAEVFGDGFSDALPEAPRRTK